ncbi:hypothetical protein [Butyrivibrio fibrisolvens]|uniref:hypothetical protein n=1 Tax=Butyrivibrio fibrisolvens TaxID=831 RepID=UPI0003B5EDE3|nr:hypothetical protein [Butyrivibrio fibrisolvens]
MKVTVICEVKDNADYALKHRCISEQTSHDFKAVFACNAHVDMSHSVETDNLCTIVKNDKNANWDIIIKLIDSSYVIFVAEQDFISVDYIRMIAKVAEEKDSDIVSCDIAYGNVNAEGYVYSNLSPLRSILVEYDNKKLKEMYSKYASDSADIGMLYGKCIRTELFKEACEGKQLLRLDDAYSYIIDHSYKFTNIHGAYYFKHEMSAVDKESYFNSITTPISKGFPDYEDMKKSIAGNKYKIISFDVFDTLILRNVYEPTDLFQFMDDDYNRLFETTAYTRFFLMRMASEDVCRKRVFKQYKDYEDITLDEIYDTMADLYQLDSSKLQLLKDKEIELEHEFCIQRKCGKDLYDLAIYSGKKVICTSDMYLPKNVISKILEENGYEDITEVYVSSETRTGKYTGNAFCALSKWTGAPTDSILHIGDNYVADVDKAIKNGVAAFYLPKALDLFWGRDKNLYKGEAASYIFGMNGAENDYMSATLGNLGLRCLLAQIINKFYDSPYTGFNSDSDYDADPYFIGYFALGMHLWALADWITRESGNYKKIHFLSRDGYVLKIVYDLMNQGKEAVPSSYTYMSRNIVALCDIEKKEDLWAMREKVTAYAATPKKFVKILKPGITDESEKKIIEDLSKCGLKYEDEVKDEENFTKALNAITPYIDWNNLNQYRNKLKKYFLNVFGQDECMVDAGYNGRVEASIEELCGIKLDSFYFHVGEDKLYERENRYTFTNRCFYEAHPIASYLVREQFISKLAPSIKGIEFSDDETKLIFGEYEENKYSEFVTQTIQDAAVDYATDVMSTLGNYTKYLKYRSGDVSRPFDYLCNHGKDLDISIFTCTEFEDDFGVNRRFNLSEYWKDLLVKNNVQKFDNRNLDDYLIFKKYYLKAEKLLPKKSKRRAIVRKAVKTILMNNKRH